LLGFPLDQFIPVFSGFIYQVWTFFQDCAVAQMFSFEVGMFSMVEYDFGMLFFSSCRGYETVGRIASTPGLTNKEMEATTVLEESIQYVVKIITVIQTVTLEDKTGNLC